MTSDEKRDSVRDAPTLPSSDERAAKRERAAFLIAMVSLWVVALFFVGWHEGEDLLPEEDFFTTMFP